MRDSKLIRTGLATLLLGFSSLANAQFFIGADATSLTGDIEWSYSKVYFEHKLSPVRIRAGYQGDFFGLEAHVYTEDDADAFSNGYTTNLKIDTSYGAYLRMQERWAYARLGVTWFDTYYSVPAFNVTDRDVIAMPTVTIGIEWALGNNIAVNLDYTYAEGRAVYPNITSQAPGFTDPILIIDGGALGLTVKF